MADDARTDLLNDAIAVIEAITQAYAQLEPVNDSLRTIFGDFCPHQPIMPDSLLTAVERLLNRALGEGDMATYFLWECARGGGAVHEADGRVWPIKTIADLRAYVTWRARA